MRSMKRIRNALIILMFILIAYTCAQTAGAYQLGEKEVQEDGHITGMSFEHGVTQADIMQIAELKNLKHLDLSFSDAVSENNIDLSPLGNLTDLQELSIYFYTDPDSIDFSFIKDLHNLRSIYIDRCGKGLDLSPFENLVHLQEVYIEYMDDVDLNCLKNCKDLRQIHIVGQYIRNLDGISGASNLESLYLCDNTHDWNTDPDNEKPLNLCALGGLSKLKELYLIRIGVTDITPLSELENLSYLVLSETGVEDVKALRNLENLYNLEIFGNKSIKVKKQVETYMKHVETVTVTEEVPYGF
ncbi:MAG: hypothetical protein K2O15_00935 [Lachnospiraceae bacterium]|nr:hypothetical protein [Lachnospiraceae bacterium]